MASINIALWGGRSKTGTTFLEKQKHLASKQGRRELLSLLAASRTWGKHPRELRGEPFDDRMLTDMMAVQDWILQHTLGV